MATKQSEPARGDLTWVVQQNVARVYKITEIEAGTFSAVSLDDPFNRGGLFAMRVPIEHFRPYEAGKTPVKSAAFMWSSYEFPKAKIR